MQQVKKGIQDFKRRKLIAFNYTLKYRYYPLNHVTRAKNLGSDTTFIFCMQNHCLWQPRVTNAKHSVKECMQP